MAHEATTTTASAFKRNRVTTLSILAGFIFLVILLGMVASILSGGASVFDGAIRVSFIAAFLGGFLALLSPCSAALLPAFFAYTFKAKRDLLRMTFVFYLGLVAVFVPLAFSTSLIGNFLVRNRETFIFGAGVVLIVLGILELAGIGLGALTRLLPGVRAGSGKRTVGAVFLLGATFAIGGGCSGAILGGILTLAAASGSTLQATSLLLVYALGMVTPLFALALFFERSPVLRRLLVGRTFHYRLLGRERQLHTTSLLSGLLLLFLGIILVSFRGGFAQAFTPLFGRLGFFDLFYVLNEQVYRFANDPRVIVAFFAILVAVVFLVRRVRRRLSI